jgi:hypothetical protein
MSDALTLWLDANHRRRLAPNACPGCSPGAVSLSCDSDRPWIRLDHRVPALPPSLVVRPACRHLLDVGFAVVRHLHRHVRRGRRGSRHRQCDRGRIRWGDAALDDHPGADPPLSCPHWALSETQPHLRVHGQRPAGAVGAWAIARRSRLLEQQRLRPSQILTSASTARLAMAIGEQASERLNCLPRPRLPRLRIAHGSGVCTRRRPLSISRRTDVSRS